MKHLDRLILYNNKLVRPYINKLMLGMHWVTYIASLAVLLGVVFEYGFDLPADKLYWVSVVYKSAWSVFLADFFLLILLDYRESKRKFRKVAWIMNVLLLLTLVPVIFHQPEVEGSVQNLWLFLDSRTYRLPILIILSLQFLSSGLVTLLGRRTNPSLILAVSFLAIILIGSGLLMLPRCTFDGVTLSWVDSLFISTSAVCVTGLVPLDISTTFTPLGLTVIILLIQVGGIGVMTLTSFFAMFFMGNTSLYNQIIVRDMMSSESLNSLLSTLLYILLFTFVIEALGMVAIWTSVHGTLDMSIKQELAFAAFHSISAFCNAGFSTMAGNLGNPQLMAGSSMFYIYISLLVILGGIGFPILVNFKSILSYYYHALSYRIRYAKPYRNRRQHIYNLNTKIVLIMTAFLLLLGTASFLIFEWNNAFAGMSVADKFVHAFFNSACPRTAGFNSVDLTALSLQSVLVYILLMWVGGAAQSTAGGVKVNAFAVVILNLFAVIRGTERVEIFGRELSVDSIRRSNATVVMSVGVLFSFIFVLTILEPDISLLALAFESISALSTVGSSLNITGLLGNPAKILISLLMFIGRVGLITLMLGIVRQKHNTRYRYPSGTIIIN